MAAITRDDRFIEVMEGGKPRDMCELLDRVEEKGIAKGIEIGIEKGIEKCIEKGIEKGIDQSRVESIKNVMEGLKYTAQQAMDLLKIPAADQSKYLSRL